MIIGKIGIVSLIVDDLNLLENILMSIAKCLNKVVQRLGKLIRNYCFFCQLIKQLFKRLTVSIRRAVSSILSTNYECKRYCKNSENPHNEKVEFKISEPKTIVASNKSFKTRARNNVTSQYWHGITIYRFFFVQRNFPFLGIKIDVVSIHPKESMKRSSYIICEKKNGFPIR